MSAMLPGGREATPAEATTWLVFSVGHLVYTIDLDAVAEVVAARKPHLVPLISLAIGGVLNLRGEPLPVVDGGAVLQNEPCAAHRHALVFESEEQRIGLLVDYVLRIDRDFRPGRVETLEGPSAGGPCIGSWKRSPDGGALGIVDSAALIARAAELLAGQRIETREEPCQNAF